MLSPSEHGIQIANNMSHSPSQRVESQAAGSIRERIDPQAAVVVEDEPEQCPDRRSVRGRAADWRAPMR